MIQVEAHGDPNSPAIKTLNQLDLLISPASIAGFLKNFVVTYLQSQAEQRFAMEGDDAVGKWIPLRDSTIRIRAEKGFPPGPINVRTGELKEFVVGNQGAIGVDVGSTLEWPTNLPEGIDLTYKFRVAQTGALGKKTSVPARPVIGISFKDMAAINALLGGFIDSAKKVRG